MSSLITSFPTSTQIRPPTSPACAQLFGKHACSLSHHILKPHAHVDAWNQLQRFLVMGTQTGVYDVNAPRLTPEKAAIVRACLHHDGQRLVALLKDLSGRLPSSLRQDTIIPALALAAVQGDALAQGAAMAALPQICRQAADVLVFAKTVTRLGGWSERLRYGMARWYEGKPILALIQQWIQFQSQPRLKASQASLRDLLRVVGPLARQHPERARLFELIWQKGYARHAPIGSQDFEALEAWQRLQQARKVQQIVDLIKRYHLPLEAIPGQWLHDPRVWSALMASSSSLPPSELLAVLPKMAAFGVFDTDPSLVELTVQQLCKRAWLRKYQVHPITILAAWRAYAGGPGLPGGVAWQPLPTLVEALKSAFQQSIKALPSVNSRLMVALDVSGSMGLYPMAGSCLTPREIATTMALTAMAQSNHCHVEAFSQGLTSVQLDPCQGMRLALRQLDRLPAGATDCALPLQKALQQRQEVDHFVIYTDGEVNVDRAQTALEQYRQGMGVNAQLIIINMGVNSPMMTPLNPGITFIEGFNSATPVVISELMRINS